MVILKVVLLLKNLVIVYVENRKTRSLLVEQKYPFQFSLHSQIEKLLSTFQKVDTFKKMLLMGDFYPLFSYHITLYQGHLDQKTTDLGFDQYYMDTFAFKTMSKV